MCVNPDCTKFSLICNNLECQDYSSEYHEDCQTVLLRKVTDNLLKRAQKQEVVLKDTNEIEENFFQEIIKSREYMENDNSFGEIEDIDLKIIKEIYEKNNR